MTIHGLLGGGTPDWSCISCESDCLACSTNSSRVPKSITHLEKVEVCSESTVNSDDDSSE